MSETRESELRELRSEWLQSWEDFGASMERLSTFLDKFNARASDTANLRARAEKAERERGALWDAIIPKGPRCRDCADFDGRCQGDGPPCEPQERALAELSALRARVGELEALTVELEKEADETPIIAYMHGTADAKDVIKAFRARAEAAERRLLPEKLSDRQREAVAMALHEYGSPSLDWIEACDVAGYDVMVADADAFHAALSRIEKENADG